MTRLPLPNIKLHVEEKEVVIKAHYVEKPGDELLPVSKLALMRRINRKLSKQDERLYARRGIADGDEPGDHYVVNTRKNTLIEANVNPEQKGRELGVLQPWEALQEEAYEKGREEGYDEGREFGQEEGREFGQEEGRKGVEEAYEKGYEAGYEKGREVGQEEGRVKEDE